MSKIEKAISLAKEIANDPAHGYDQSLRWGPDYDCSSFLISVWEAAGVPVKTHGATYTGNMRDAFVRSGFEIVRDCELITGALLQDGDILLNEENHVAMLVNGHQLIQASINENGAVSGGLTGDQTGREIGIVNWYSYPWDIALRYKGAAEFDDAIEGAEDDGTYTVRRGDTLWGIAEKELGDGTLWADIAKLNGLKSDLLTPGAVLKLWDDKCAECAVKPPEAALDEEEYTEYTVKNGDSLWGIARRTGDSDRWEKLADINGIQAPFTIYVGQKLKLPLKWS